MKKFGMEEKRFYSLDKVIEKALNNNKTWDDHEAYRLNAQWLGDNLGNIREQYRGKIVVVLNKRIVFSDEDTEKVRAKVRSLPNPNQSYIRYIPAEKEVLLL